MFGDEQNRKSLAAVKLKATMKRTIAVVTTLGALAILWFHVTRQEDLRNYAAMPATPAAPIDESPSSSIALETSKRELTVDKAPQESALVQATSGPVTSPAEAILNASLVTRSVDVLVSPQSTHSQKQEAWKHLRDAGKLDDAIADLEQRTASDPRVAEYPAALGQAYLQRCGTLQDVREQGILAMKADKAFDSALNLDSSNWEARFSKAVAMSYWPPMLNKAEEVIWHFETLVQQQEAQTSQPQFAETYAWLGDQYLKAGRSNDAQLVWKRGAALFPTNEKLQTKLAAAH